MYINIDSIFQLVTSKIAGLLVHMSAFLLCLLIESRDFPSTSASMSPLLLSLSPDPQPAGVGFHHHTMTQGLNPLNVFKVNNEAPFWTTSCVAKEVLLHHLVVAHNCSFEAAFSGDYFLNDIAWWFVTQDEFICSIHHHQSPTNHTMSNHLPPTQPPPRGITSECPWLHAMHSTSSCWCNRHPGCQSPTRMTWHVFRQPESL